MDEIRLCDRMELSLLVGFIAGFLFGASVGLWCYVTLWCDMEILGFVAGIMLVGLVIYTLKMAEGEEL